MKRCPECGHGNRDSAETCKSCGADLPEAKRPGLSTIPRMCAFRDGERQCPAHSEWHEAGEMWYCRWHSPHNTRQANTQILDDLLRNGIPRKPNWRDFYVDMMIRGKTRLEAAQEYTKRYEQK